MTNLIFITKSANAMQPARFTAESVSEQRSKGTVQWTVLDHSNLAALRANKENIALKAAQF